MTVKRVDEPLHPGYSHGKLVIGRDADHFMVNRSFGIAHHDGYSHNRVSTFFPGSRSDDRTIRRGEPTAKLSTRNEPDVVWRIQFLFNDAAIYSATIHPDAGRGGYLHDPELH